MRMSEDHEYMITKENTVYTDIINITQLDIIWIEDLSLYTNYVRLMEIYILNF